VLLSKRLPRSKREHLFPTHLTEITGQAKRARSQGGSVFCQTCCIKPNHKRRITMYQIKIEHQCTSRWYKAESHWDAIELFDMLTKTCRFVQLWQGMNLLSEYKN
jgi:hypothetical protein